MGMGFYRNFLNLVEWENESKTCGANDTKNQREEKDQILPQILSYLEPFLIWDKDPKDKGTQTYPTLCLEKILPIPIDLENPQLPQLPRVPKLEAFKKYQKAYQKMEQDNISAYGVRTRQEWIEKNWGNTSGKIRLKINQRLEDLVLEFETEKSPPISLVAALKEKTGKKWGLVFEPPT